MYFTISFYIGHIDLDKCFIIPHMNILYYTSSDWSRESYNGAHKTPCLPRNK